MRSPRDSAIADALQTGLPLAERPYREIALATGCDEALVLETTERLVSDGTIRSFGAFVDYYKLGYEGVLCGVMAGGDVETVASALSARSDVTHNYHRAGRVGLWFTALLGEGGLADVELALSRIGHPFVILRTERRIKLKPSFHLSEGDARPAAPHPVHDEPCTIGKESVDAESLRLLALLQEHFPVASRPFREAEQRTGIAEGETIARLASLAERGILRRIGASLHHGRVGYSANALLAIDAGDSDACAHAGRTISIHPWVSHCYVRSVARSTLPFAWPYGLYAMIHARGEAELTRMIDGIKKELSPDAIEAMPTLREFKKSRYLL